MASVGFTRCSPAEFHLGDIVQADVSIVAFYNAKRNVYMVHPVLRAIYLLDRADRLVSVSSL